MKNIPALVQGIYFLATGIWPLLSINSFMKITGPKCDIWLVKTVGVIVAGIGAGLVQAGYEDSASASTMTIAIGSAAGLAAIDVVYVAKKVISSVYLADALVEVCLILLWLLSRW